MGEITIEKFLVQELAQHPFNLDFTVASFTKLTCQELIELLLLIIREIDPDRKHVDFSTDDCQAVYANILEFLRIVKYTPPQNSDPDFIRQSILEGDPEFVVPVLAWLLVKKDELKIRAYLAKFLVKIPVPEEDDLILDDEVATTYNKYENLLEEFKTVHKEHTKYQSCAQNVDNLTNQIELLEHDIECVQSKIEGMKYRLNENGENQDPSMKELVHAVRIAEIKSRELLNDEQKEETICDELEVQLTRFRDLYYEESNNSYHVYSGEEMLHNLIEETGRLKHLVHEKCPQDYDVLRRQIHALQRVEENPPGSQMGLNEMMHKNAIVEDEIRALDLRKHIKSTNQQLFILREKAAALYNQKMSLGAQLEPLHNGISIIRAHTYQVIQEKTQRNRQIAKEERDFQQYVDFMEDKHNYYKQLKSEVHKLKKEVGVLSSTKFILDGQWRESEWELEEMESELGLPGMYAADLDKLEGIAMGVGSRSINDADGEWKRQRLLELCTSVKQLVEEISEKKESLQALVDASTHSKGMQNILDVEYETKKQSFEARCMSYQTGNKKLQLAIEGRKKELEDSQFQLVKLKCLFSQLNVTKFRVTEEKVSQGLSFHSFRDKLFVKILEQERVQKQLQKDRAQVEDYQTYSRDQMQLWSDVIALLKCKINGRMMPSPYYEVKSESDGYD